jgi:hypothetical protein
MNIVQKNREVTVFERQHRILMYLCQDIENLSFLFLCRLFFLIFHSFPRLCNRKDFFSFKLKSNDKIFHIFCLCFVQSFDILFDFISLFLLSIYDVYESIDFVHIFSLPLFYVKFF